MVTSSTQYDICIIGGGPTGLSAAIMASQRGYSVCIFEPKEAVIDKACGEGLMPTAIKTLEEMKVFPEYSHPFIGIRYFDGENFVDGEFKQGAGQGIRRIALHQALLDRLQELPVARIHQRVTKLIEHQNHIEVEDISAQFVLVADGINSSIRKKLGLELPPKRRKRMGVRRHFQIKPWSDYVEVYWGEHAECYVTPVAEDQIGIAVTYYQDHAPKGGNKFEQFMEQFPALQAKIKDIPYSSHSRGAGPFEQRLSSPQKGRIMLIGDASGYLDPITGEGIRLGFGAAEKALDLIQSGKWTQYHKEHWKLIRKYWILTDSLLRLRQISFLRKLMVPFLQFFPKLFGRIVSDLG